MPVIINKKAGKPSQKKRSGVRARKTPNGKGHSSIVKNTLGVPQAEPPKHKSLTGYREPPPTDGKPNLEREKIKGQVEILLLKGVTTINQIAVHVGISHITAQRYIEEVYYRWALLGGAPRMKQLRGEARARLDLLTSELWMIFQNANSDTVKMAALGQLTGVHDRRMILDGLTPTMINVLVADSGDDQGNSVDDRIRDHKRMTQLASALAGYMKGTKTIEGEAEHADGSKS